MDLEFIPTEASMASALISAEAFQQRYGIDASAVESLLLSVLKQNEEHVYPKGGGGLLAVDAATRQALGTCGYPAAPDAKGEVEIAYFTFPAYEGRGIARQMARELVERASARPDVRLIIAHTLPHHSASTRILIGLGFSHAGTINHPEDGEIWRWERMPLR
jgi:RimJ/RimL family protein N-acetyltransferase